MGLATRCARQLSLRASGINDTVLHDRHDEEVGADSGQAQRKTAVDVLGNRKRRSATKIGSRMAESATAWRENGCAKEQLPRSRVGLR